MNITTVSGTSQTSAAWQTQRSGHGATRKAFDAAAQTLGMSASDLRDALKSGQSMASLAQSKGVSTDTLTSAISSALSGSDSSLSTSQAAELAQRIVAGPQGGNGAPDGPQPGGQGGPAGPPPGGQGGPDGPPPGGHGGPPPAVAGAMDSLAGTLGISSDDLESSLQSGTSLTDVAAAHGMDADTLKTTLTNALTAADASLTADQAGSLADDLIAGPAQRRQQHHQVARLSFDMQLSGSDSASGSAVSQAALKAMYDRYAAASTAAQPASTL